jgi:hypothetical protein
MARIDHRFCPRNVMAAYSIDMKERPLTGGGQRHGR